MRKRWLDESALPPGSALSFCMLLPGPEAMQLATYVGWRLHGHKRRPCRRVCCSCCQAPWSCWRCRWVYAAFGNVPIVEAVFFGIKAAVLVIVIEALLRIAKRALNPSSTGS